MAATNIFYRIPSQRGIRIATLTGSDCTLNQLCDYIIDSEGLNRNDFIVASGTKVFRPNSSNLQSISLRNNTHVDIIIPLLGGKGGFGSLLRAIGAQIEKTTNRDACRDLSGRRLRDVKREDELRKLLALQEKLEEEKKRRRKEKLEKLKKKSEASSASVSIQELVSMFDDQEYNKRRIELGDIIQAAVDKGIINFKKRQQDEKDELERSKRLRVEESNNGGLKSSGDGKDSEQKDNVMSTAESPNEVTTKPNPSRMTNSSPTKKAINKTKRKDLWLGLDDDDIDEDEDGNEESLAQEANSQITV